jgi:hypothetical protein
MEEWMYRSHIYLASALAGGEWSASRPGRFTPRERAPGTHWIGGSLNPRAGLDAAGKGKILHCRESNPGSPAHSPSLYRLPETVARDGKFRPWIFTVCFTSFYVSLLVRWVMVCLRHVPSWWATPRVYKNGFIPNPCVAALRRGDN